MSHIKSLKPPLLHQILFDSQLYIDVITKYDLKSSGQIFCNCVGKKG